MKKNQKQPKPEFITNLQLWIPDWGIIFGYFFWTYIIFKNYFERYPVNLEMLEFIFSLKEFNSPVFTKVISTWFSHIYSIVIVCSMLISAFWLGQKIKKYILPEMNSLDEDFILSVGLGFGILIFLTFIIGLAGGLYREIFIAIFVFLTFLGVFELRNFFSKTERTTQKNKKKSFLFFFLWCVIILCSITTLITALTPETFYDSMQYHIGVPLLWVLEHKIHEIPTIGQSYYQMNIHLLYAVGLLLRNEQVVKLLNFLFGILSVFTIYVFSKKFFSKNAGLLASSLFFSTPIVMYVFSRTCVELPITFFDILMLFCFLNFLETDDNRWLYSSGIFMGLSIGSKYISFASFISLTLSFFIYTLLFKRENFLKNMKKIILWGFISGFLFLPWAIKNYVYIKNPIYPFTIDKENGLCLLGAKKADYTDQSKVPLSPRNILTMPWRITMGEFQESFSGPVFLFLLPFLFFVKNSNKNSKFLLLYIFFWYLIWIPLARGYIRHFIPALAPLSAVLSYYLVELKINQFFKKSIIFLLLIFSLANLFLIMSSQKMSQNPLGYVLGLQSKEEYLSIQRPTYVCPYYQTINWANKNLPEGSKIVFLGETRPCYSERKVFTHSVSDFNPLVLWCKNVRDEKELRGKLLQEGVTHILLNIPEARRLGGYDIFQFEEKDFEIFCKFWNKYVREIYHGIADVTLNNGIRGSKIPEFWNSYTKSAFNYVYLYEIMSEEEANKPHERPYNFFLHKELFAQPRYDILKPVIEKFFKPG